MECTRVFTSSPKSLRHADTAGIADRFNNSNLSHEHIKGLQSLLNRLDNDEKDAYTIIKILIGVESIPDDIAADIDEVDSFIDKDLQDKLINILRVGESIPDDIGIPRVDKTNNFIKYTANEDCFIGDNLQSNLREILDVTKDDIIDGKLTEDKIKSKLNVFMKSLDSVANGLFTASSIKSSITRQAEQTSRQAEQKSYQTKTDTLKSLQAAADAGIMVDKLQNLNWSPEYAKNLLSVIDGLKVMFDNFSTHIIYALTDGMNLRLDKVSEEFFNKYFDLGFIKNTWNGTCICSELSKKLRTVFFINQYHTSLTGKQAETRLNAFIDYLKEYSNTAL